MPQDHTHEQGANPPPRPEPEPATPTSTEPFATNPDVGRRTPRVSVELGCLLCGRELGTLECDAWPAAGPVVPAHPGAAPLLVAD
jgi:hypothetical protein